MVRDLAMAALLRVRGMAGLLWTAALVCAPWAAAAECPNPPAASIASKTIPSDVCIPKGFTDLTIDFFDDYSWRAFAALTARTPEGALVFESFHPLWEVFHEDGSAPGAAARFNACAAEPKGDEIVLASFSGFGDIGQAGDGALLAPLVAQNGKYVRYLTAYNQTAYDHIVSHQWYLRSKLPEVPTPKPPEPPVQFPDGSIVVKSAWVETEGFTASQIARMYTRLAMVRDPETGKCGRKTVGLIGLHIVQKTPSRPQWIWSSFEQADLVPPAEAGGPGTFVLHNGQPGEMPARNPLTLIPLAKDPKPFNVVRAAKLPIHPKTMETNARYRRLLAGSVWGNYQLAMTQWPLQPGDQSVPVPARQGGDIFETFPGDGATSAFANMSMESFNQSRPAQGCMNCHNRARMTADFMWSVYEHAFPAKIALPAPAAK
ncbi:MAG: hypothetical protein KGN84_20845 [Acidobacteriota bacterium]|nr:hypothetical protein [Acidobacteriota bacterium]